MTSSNERVRELCERIVKEQDANEMTVLVQQLNLELEYRLPEKLAESAESNREMKKSV